MEQTAGAQIGKRAFIQSILILLALMMIAGILTLVVPAGEYNHIEVDGRETIDPNSFQFVEKPNYPIWRWFTAPIEVLGSESGLTVIVIIIVLFFAGERLRYWIKQAPSAHSLAISSEDFKIENILCSIWCAWRSCFWVRRLAHLKKSSCWCL